MENTDGVPVAQTVYVFEEAHVMFVKFGMIHPSHRGNKYWTVAQIMDIGLAEHLQITSSYSWFLKTNPINPNAMNVTRTKFAAAGADISVTGVTSTDLQRNGEPVFNTREENLVKNQGTIAQWRLVKTANSDWADVTFTIS